jgi:TRAP-type C4-dicarboxylate transport system permease small subunit
MARFIFLWLSWIGASYAVRERSHFRVEMFANMIKGRSRALFEYFILAVWFLFSFFLAWYGTKLFIFLLDTGQVSSAMQIPMTWPYAAVPVGSALMCVRLILEIVKIHKYGMPVPEVPGADAVI